MCKHTQCKTDPNVFQLRNHNPIYYKFIGDFFFLIIIRFAFFAWYLSSLQNCCCYLYFTGLFRRIHFLGHVLCLTHFGYLLSRMKATWQDSEDAFQSLKNKMKKKQTNNITRKIINLPCSNTAFLETWALRPTATGSVSSSGLSNL